MPPSADVENNMANQNNNQKTARKRVLVVGAGAAGMSCAQQLAEHQDKFDVTLMESVNYCGGQAFSIDIDKDKFGAPWLNQGVQGGSYIYHHTMTMFQKMGYRADPVELQVSFGKDETFWTNVFPTKLLADHQKEVKRFHTMLKIVRKLELFFAVVPLWITMKLFRFSTFFANTVAMPTIALFLGTGNYTPQVPTMILERLFTSPTYGMWYPGDKNSIASNQPPMVVFPKFTEFYTAWQKSLEERGVKVRLCTEVTEVRQRGSKGVTVRIVSMTPDGQRTGEERDEEYDEIVLCVLADAAKRVLGKSGSFLEKRILGAAKFSDDITVTHHDGDYIRKHYEVDYNEEQAVSSLDGIDQSARLKAAKDGFKPMYLVKTNPEDRSKLDLCFDCSNYQGQFPPNLPFEKHIFQTIFLNKDRDGHLWTIDEIDKDKIIQKNWWHQLCHSWTHYVSVVPLMWLLQGKRHTRFAASWTLVNAHEVAVISGIAAAVNLGAKYPLELERDEWSFLAFRLYYLLQYRSWFKRRLPKGEEGEGKDWASGWYGSFYKGPGVAKEERSMWKELQAKGESAGQQ